MGYWSIVGGGIGIQGGRVLLGYMGGRANGINFVNLLIVLTNNFVSADAWSL